MKPTNHAIKRWAERFPELDMKREFFKAVRPLSASEFALIRRRSSNPKSILRANKDFKGVYFRKTDSGICFVIAPGEVVLTAFVVNRGEYAKANLDRNLRRVTKDWERRTGAA
jgi:hypothetical protein